MYTGRRNGIHVKTLLTATLLWPLALSAATNCADLASLSLPNLTVTSAAAVAAGEFTSPNPGRGPNAANAFKKVPAFCRVMARLKPTSDSDIKIEVWMPASGWNGKLQSVGNGAFAGAIGYPALGTAITAGYAAASTDTGHEGGAGDFVVGHPERLIDFAWRAVHEMTVAAKGIISAYYASAPKYSYWNGCSTGGRQAMAEAQRFPADYDGIIAGAPASYVTRLQATQITISQATHKNEASYIPPEKYPLIHNAVLEKCDMLDGVKDGVLEDPTRCRFDPKVLECKDGADNSQCLTPPQVQLARTVYAGLVSGKGDHLFPGLEPGSELGWNSLSGPQPMSYAIDIYRYFALNEPKWDYLTFNVDTDLPKAEKAISGTMNSIDPNLRPFISRGGKLLQYHGWSDNGIPAESSVNYYNNVLEMMGGAVNVKDNYRLFMVPGMFHCGGGDGTSTFDMVAALDEWVVNKKAPDSIPASRVRNGVVDRTRPLCPYPQIGVYKGSGSTDEAGNFSCRLPTN
jgi:feruloyl esterase